MIDLQVLGAIGLVGSDGRDIQAVLAQPKRIGLLTYLVLAEPFGFHRRDTLLALFWPELGDVEGRRALRQALHFLRHHLGPAAIQSRGTDEIGLDRGAIRCDSWELRDCLDRGEDEAALGWYRGELLAGFHITGVAPEYDQWLEQIRSATGRAVLRAARRAADAAAAAGQVERSEQCARVALDHRDVEDGDVLRLMRLLRASGNGAAARTTYEEYAGRLKDNEVGEPGRELREFVMAMDAEARRDNSPISSVLAPSVELSSARQVPDPKPARARRRWRLALPAVLALVCLVAWQSVSSGWRRSSSVTEADPQVAVAILSNRTADTSLDRLGTIAAEWITRSLTRVPRIRVLDLNVLASRGRSPSGGPVDPMTLARQTRSTYVVGGAFYAVTGDSVRFAADVLDGRSGQVVRSLDAVLASRADPVHAINELSNRLASAIQSVVDPRDMLYNSPVLVPPRYESFLEYVQAQEDFFERGNAPRAMDHALRATQLDTSFAMAAVFATVAAVTSGRCDLVDSITAALRNRSALTEFEQTTLGMSTVRCQRNWEEGAILQRRRLQLQPASMVVRITAANTFIFANRPAEAIALLEAADFKRDLAALPPGASIGVLETRADAYHQLGDFAKERALADELLGSGRDSLRLLYLRARSAAGQGDTSTALSAAHAILDQQGEPVTESVLADDAMGTWTPTAAWVVSQIAAELAAHGAVKTARALALESLRRLVDSAGREAHDVRQYERGRLLLLADRAGEAEATFRGLVSRHPASIRLRGALGVAAARAGDRGSADAARRWIEGRTGVIPPGLPAYYYLAVVANSGDVTDALDRLERLPYGAHPHEFIEFHVDPLLAPLHTEERFRRLIQPR